MQFIVKIQEFERGFFTFHEHCNLLGIEIEDILFLNFASLPELLDMRYVYTWSLSGKRVCTSVTFDSKTCVVADPNAAFVSYYDSLSKDLYFSEVSSSLDIATFATVDRPAKDIIKVDQSFSFRGRSCTIDQLSDTVLSVLKVSGLTDMGLPVSLPLATGESYFTDVMTVLEPHLMSMVRLVCPCRCFSTNEMQRRCACTAFVVGESVPIPGTMLYGTHWEKYVQLQVLFKRFVPVSVWDKRFASSIPHFVRAVCGVVGYPRYLPGVLHFSNGQVIVDCTRKDVIVPVTESRAIRVERGVVFRVEGFCSSSGSTIYRMGGTKVALLRKDDDQLGFVSTFLSRFIIFSSPTLSPSPLSSEIQTFLTEMVFKNKNEVTMQEFISFFSVVNVSLSLTSFHELVRSQSISVEYRQGDCFLRIARTTSLPVSYPVQSLPVDFDDQNLESTISSLVARDMDVASFIVLLRESYPALNQSDVVTVFAKALDRKLLFYSMRDGGFFVSTDPGAISCGSSSGIMDNEELFEIVFGVLPLPTEPKELLKLVGKVLNGVNLRGRSYVEKRLTELKYNGALVVDQFLTLASKHGFVRVTGDECQWVSGLNVVFVLDGQHYQIGVEPGTSMVAALAKLQERILVPIIFENPIAGTLQCTSDGFPIQLVYKRKGKVSSKIDLIKLPGHKRQASALIEEVFYARAKMAIVDTTQITSILKELSYDLLGLKDFLNSCVKKWELLTPLSDGMGYIIKEVDRMKF